MKSTLARSKPLRRKTPLRAKSALKKTPLRRVSKKRAKENQEYAKVKREYLKAHPVCEGCHSAKATSLHHYRGRIKGLLCDTRFFKALCHGCHEFVHLCPLNAREMGLLAPINEWNVVPKKEG